MESTHTHDDHKDHAMAASQPNKITEITDDVDPRTVQVDDYDPGSETEGDDISFEDLEHGDDLTTTQNLQQEQRRHHTLQTAETVDQIIDLGVEFLDPEAETHIVRVYMDIGPVYYGGTEQPIELKKNRRYQVPTHIHRYLYERGLLVDQLVENPV